MSSAQIGRIQFFGNNGFNLESSAFQAVSLHSIYTNYILMILRDTVEDPPKMDRSRTVTTKIPITLSDDGCPELPKISMYDNYKTKTVQSMLREYCTAHIREHYFYILTE